MTQTIDYKRHMTGEECEVFIRNYKNLCKYFGEERVKRVGSLFALHNFATWKYVPLNSGEDSYLAKSGYPVICDKTSWSFTEYKGEWEKKVQKPAREYLVPSEYQNDEGKLILKCLEDMCPFTMALIVSCYHCDRGDDKDEVYVKCDDGKSLYCPLAAFRDRDFSIIEDRHRSYMELYYGNTPERREKYLGDALATLETKTAKLMEKYLSGEVKYVPAPVVKAPKYPEWLMFSLRQRFGLESTDTSKDSLIEKYSPFQVVNEYLNWKGIIGYTSEILNVVECAFGIELYRKGE